MPWEIHKQYDNDPRLNGKRRLIRDHMDNGETQVIASNIWPENVALLHAAPDMLAALQMFCDFQDNPNAPDLVHWVGEFEQEARAILSRIDKDSTDAA
jgi:hypothetical protein